ERDDELGEGRKLSTEAGVELTELRDDVGEHDEDHDHRQRHENRRIDECAGDAAAQLRNQLLITKEAFEHPLEVTRALPGADRGGVDRGEEITVGSEG